MNRLNYTTLHLSLFAVFAVFVGVAAPTQAFFSDRENGRGEFVAGHLDAVLTLESATKVSRTLRLGSDSTEEFLYTVSTKFDPVSDFCSELTVRVERGGEKVYEGALSLFALPPHELNPEEEYTFEYHFSTWNENRNYPKQSCSVRVVYEAAQEGFEYGEAFYDTEMDSFTLIGEDFGKTPHRDPGEIVISEIMYDPDGDDTGREWAEIHNGTGKAIDLTTWTLLESGTNHSIDSFNDSQFITPGGYAIIADDPAIFLSEHPEVGVPVFDSSFEMPNTSNTLLLKNEKGEAVDEVSYPPPSGASDNGRSIQLNASDKKFCVGRPTPGEKNTCQGNGGQDKNVGDIVELKVEPLTQDSLSVPTPPLPPPPIPEEEPVLDETLIIEA